jgi:hypothetical protein
MADKDKQPQQKDFDKAFENMKAGKTMPTENDMGPMKDPKKGAEQGAKAGMGGKTLGMKKGGKVSQLAKANGIAVRGKTRGKIC